MRIKVGRWASGLSLVKLGLGIIAVGLKIAGQDTAGRRKVSLKAINSL